MVLNVLTALVVLAFPVWIGDILFFFLIIGFGVIALLCSMHLIRLFDPERARESEELEEAQRRLRDSE